MTLPIRLNEQTPPSLAYKLVAAEQVKLHEGQAASASGASLFDLMTRAGQAAFRWLQQRYPEARKVAVLAGWGNNAGDAYIVAALAKKAGMQVKVCCADLDHTLPADATVAKENWLSLGGECVNWQLANLNQVDLIIDGLLGTGLQGDVRPPLQDLIAWVNRSGLPVLSLDLPSGMDADTGRPLPIAIQAHSTVTFVAIKPGLVTGQGKGLCGELVYADLDIASDFFKRAKVIAQLMSWPYLSPLTKRQQHANKGNFGRLLCIGGNRGMPGAIRLCAEAALRSGVGLVKVLCHADSQLAVGAGRPELMPSADCSIAGVRQALEWSTCVVLGPGLGQDAWAQSLVTQVLEFCQQQARPLVLDADALNLIAMHKHQFSRFSVKNAIMTPHPGEASRLLGCQIAQIEQDRLSACQSLANEFGVIALLKGAGTIICRPQVSALTDDYGQSQAVICADGNPGMATAGMGDVLSGVIAAMLAQGFNSAQAAIHGVCLHALAGDKVASQYGQRGMLASDLYPKLRELINLESP